MSRAFPDTSFYQALLNPGDKWHASALELSGTFQGQLVTSEYVLCELGALMSRGHLRALFLALVQELESAAAVEVISASHEYFQEGLALFWIRPDKEWSLTDCISFVLMQHRDITDALSTDRHFEQAGFHPLLRW